MSPYLIVTLIGGTLLLIVGFFVYLDRTVFLPVEEGAQESPEVRKKKKDQVLARSRLYGIGGVMLLCLISYLCIALMAPAKKVYGAFYPSATPTVTNTPTFTPTATVTNTPRITATSRMFGALTQGAGTPTATRDSAGFVPSLGGSGSGSNTVTVLVTRVFIATKIVYVTQFVPITVVVTATPTYTPTVTNTPPSDTPTVTYTPTVDTPTSTPTPTHTPTETPTP